MLVCIFSRNQVINKVIFLAVMESLPSRLIIFCEL